MHWMYTLCQILYNLIHKNHVNDITIKKILCVYLYLCAYLIGQPTQKSWFYPTV